MRKEFILCFILKSLRKLKVQRVKERKVVLTTIEAMPLPSTHFQTTPAFHSWQSWKAYISFLSFLCIYAEESEQGQLLRSKNIRSCVPAGYLAFYDVVLEIPVPRKLQDTHTGHHPPCHCATDQLLSWSVFSSSIEIW